MSSRRCLLGSMAVLPFGSPGTAATSVASALAETIADQRQFPSSGIVAAMCSAEGRAVVTQGTADAIDGRPLDGDTVFDIGSITKLFTALLLADNVVRGEMAMDDPLAKYLPDDVKVPNFQGQPITLLDIVTYHSGLPAYPDDLPALGPAPFPAYSVERLYQALARVKLGSSPGTQYVYSNFGYGLLGLALAHHANADFESLIVSRICGPLSMDSTRISFTREMRSRVTPGHFKEKAKVEAWNMPLAFAAAGAFHSTANDLLKFLAAAMGLEPSPLGSAFRLMLKTDRAADKVDTRAALGWFITTNHSDRLIWKDGGVLGYSSFIGFSANHSNGAVVLANGNGGMLTLGQHLINAEFPLHP